MDYGAGRYRIIGGTHDGYEFHAGDCFEVRYRVRWLPGCIEYAAGQWVFLWPIDVPDTPGEVIGLPVRWSRGGLTP